MTGTSTTRVSPSGSTGRVVCPTSTRRPRWPRDLGPRMAVSVAEPCQASIAISCGKQGTVGTSTNCSTSLGGHRPTAAQEHRETNGTGTNVSKMGFMVRGECRLCQAGRPPPCGVFVVQLEEHRFPGHSGTRRAVRGLVLAVFCPRRAACCSCLPTHTSLNIGGNGAEEWCASATSGAGALASSWRHHCRVQHQPCVNR